MPRPRARDLGIQIGLGPPGPANAITDVRGVAVGHTTLISGDGPLVVGQGPVRTGVTVIVPHEGDPWREPVFGGGFSLNGNGELTGLHWIRESGLLSSVIGLSNTHAIGVVHDALVRTAIASTGDHLPWTLPVAGETWDGMLNDIDGMHVRTEHVRAAIDAAALGPVAEGNVGGGTGMVCHEFKGGIGTASRVLDRSQGGWTVGALVQANYGDRDELRIDGVPVGREIGIDEVSSPYGAERGPFSQPAPGSGSIIGIVATDAPLLPNQCEALARRAALGAARVGCYASNGSGDLFLAFATGNRGLRGGEDPGYGVTVPTAMVGGPGVTPLYLATVEAVEEAIVNCLVAAETMVGRDGITAHALPHDRLLEVMDRYGRGPRRNRQGVAGV
jgi:D-aminopeptidase